MVKLTALKSRRFGTVSVRAGETFHAPRRYARIWKALGLAADTLPEIAPPPAAPAPPAAADDLMALTKAELADIADAEGVEIARGATKADIAAAITQARATADGERAAT